MAEVLKWAHPETLQLAEQVLQAKKTKTPNYRDARLLLDGFLKNLRDVDKALDEARHELSSVKDDALRLAEYIDAKLEEQTVEAST